MAFQTMKCLNKDEDEDTGENNENDNFNLLIDQEIPLVVEQ